MYAFNELLTGNITNFIYWYLGDAFLWISYLLLSYYLTIFQEQVIQKMIVATRADILSCISEVEYEDYHKQTTGTYISWLNNDMNTIAQSGFKNLYSLISAIFLTITSVIVLLSLNIWIMLGTLALTFLIIYTPRLFNRYLKKAMERFTENNAIFVGRLEDTLKGYDTLFFSNHLNYLISKINQASNEIAESNVDYTRKSSVVSNSIALISILAQIIISFLTGILAHLGQIIFGSVLTTGSLAGNVFSSLSQALSYKVSIDSVEVVFEKYNQYRDLVPNKQMQTIIKNSDSEICLKNITYSYDDKK